MDLSKLSDEDLQALSSGDIKRVSDAGLQSLSEGQPAQTAKQPKVVPSDSGGMTVGHAALGAAELGGSAILGIPRGIGHALADLYNTVIKGDYSGRDPSWVQAIPHPQPGQAGQDVATAGSNALTRAIDASGLGGAATAAAGAVDQFGREPGTVSNFIREVGAPIAGDVATLAGARGVLAKPVAAAGALRGGLRSLVSGEGIDAAEGEAPTAASIGLKTPTTTPLTPEQQIGNTVAHAEAGAQSPQAKITPGSLKEARTAPSAVVGRVAKATPTGAVDQQTLDEIANAGGSGVPISGQGSIQNIRSMRDNLTEELKNPELTGDQKVDWMQALRAKGYKNIASQDPGAQELGEAQLDAAKAITGHIERSLPENGDVSMDQFRDAMTALAKNHTVESVLKGNDVDMPALGRIFQRNPNLLTGGLRTLGQYASENGEQVSLANRFQEPLGFSGVNLEKPATWLSPLSSAASRLAANRQATAGIQAATSAYRQGAGRFAPLQPKRFGDLDMEPPAAEAAMTASTPTAPPATAASQPGEIRLADLLSHGIEQSPAEGLSAGPMRAPAEQGLPFVRNAAHEAGDLELAPNQPGRQAPSVGDELAQVMSQGVPEGTMARAAQERKYIADTVDFPSGTKRRRIVKPLGAEFER